MTIQFMKSLDFGCLWAAGHDTWIYFSFHSYNRVTFSQEQWSQFSSHVSFVVNSFIATSIHVKPTFPTYKVQALITTLASNPLPGDQLIHWHTISALWSSYVLWTDWFGTWEQGSYHFPILSSSNLCDVSLVNENLYSSIWQRAMIGIIKKK